LKFQGEIIGKLKGTRATFCNVFHFSQAVCISPYLTPTNTCIHELCEIWDLFFSDKSLGYMN